MAIINATFNRDAEPRGGVQTVNWTGLANGDSGTPITLAELSEKTWHATGVFGSSGTVTIEGSNDGVNWSPLSTRQGTIPMTLTTSTAMNTSQDRPLWVRPRVSNGDGTTLLNVIVACHRFDLPIRD